MKLDNPTSTSVTLIKNVLKMLEKYPSYCDDMNRPHICIDNNDYLLSDKRLEDKIYSICLDNDLDVGITIINKVIRSLSNSIREKGIVLDLDYRVGKNENDDFLYQLNKEQMVLIGDSGYKNVSITKPTFKKSNTFKEQVLPTKNGNMENMLNLFNVSEDDKFLLQVYLTSLFVPKIPKASLILVGEKGTEKTTITKNIKNIVDPSPIVTTKVPNSIAELERRLGSDYLICFDNVDKISPKQSDTFCRATNGVILRRIERL